MRRESCKKYCKIRVHGTWCFPECGESEKAPPFSKRLLSARDIPGVVIGMIDARINRKNSKNPLRVGILPYSYLYLGPKPLLLSRSMLPILL